MISPILVAAEHIEWCQDQGQDLAACVLQCRIMCGWHGLEFDAEGATWDDVVEATALIWKHLDRTSAMAS